MAQELFEHLRFQSLIECMPLVLYALCVRFQSVLTVRGTESLFKIVETNDFKQLPHITLAFRPGNDAAVKQVSTRKTGLICNGTYLYARM